MIWNLLLKGVIIAIHNEQVAEHGGICGIRDDGLLDSALARPQHQSCYCSASVFDLAAAYASGIIRDHPFTDGNKRTAFLASYVFLVINGCNCRLRKSTLSMSFWLWLQVKLTRPLFQIGYKTTLLRWNQMIHIIDGRERRSLFSCRTRTTVQP